MSNTWESYEKVAQALLQQFRAEFGFERVEGKQSIPGYISGTKWEIDAKGIREGNEGFIVIECRHRKARQTQENAAALAWRILDTGAEGGLIVSPLGLQEGAHKVGKATNVVCVTLNADCTPSEFVMRFLNKVMIGLRDECTIADHLQVEVVRAP
jgi:hypothetical protein